MSAETRLDVSTLLVVLLGGVILLPFLTMGVGFGGMMAGGSMMGGAGAQGGLSSLLGPLIQLGVLGVLFGGGYLLLRRGTDGHQSDSARAELRRAYARGELSDEEFERRHATLEREG